MKKQMLTLIAPVLFSTSGFAKTKPAHTEQNRTELKRNSGIAFTENKGQVYDQNYHPRPDVLYGVMAGNMAVHIKNSGVSYQLYRVDSYKEVEDEDERTKETRKEIDQQTIYRIDLNWINFNKNFITSEDEALSGYTNYYLESCPNGALNVKSYKGVTLHNLYNGIDLHYYEKSGELKHDYIVAAHADYKQIQLKVEGAEVSLNEDGSLILNTPLGKIQEGAPLVYQNGKQLKAKWVIKATERSQIVSFEIENYNPNSELIIDPVTRLWGTYYGGTGDEQARACTTDASQNVYFTGNTVSTSGTIIATSGGHQTVSGGYYDAFLVKCNSGGTRQWGTYYGNSGTQKGYACAIDAFGNVYMTGETSSATGTVMVTTASHQSSYGGGTSDAFLVKFNSNGVRQWATYYGGTDTDYGASCAIDGSNNVYLGGGSKSNNGTTIATSGSHQTTNSGYYDSFLVKFNSSGVRQWGTYYGGAGGEYNGFCTSDALGNVILSGATTSTNSIATVGSHQSVYGGGLEDGFLVMFNSSGVRQWGTYYGGAGDDMAFLCSIDASANLYLTGFTASNTGTIIATVGSHQSTNAGGTYDAFLVKFDANGIRQWGTYYGGTGDDQGLGTCLDSNGNVYLVGATGSSTGTVIATPASQQPIYGGGTYDGFLVKFNSAGTRQWATYYGGAGEDMAFSTANDNGGNLYLTGYTDSNTGAAIATSSSHQPAYGGGTYDAFLAKFDVCEISPTQPSAIAGNTVMCAASAASIYSTSTVSGATSYVWSLPSGWSGSSNTNSISATPGSSGIISLIAANSCGSSPQQTLNVTVNSLPSLTVSTTNTTLCVGETATLSASGASSYTFNPGGAASSITITPIINTTYTLTGINTNGCSNTANFTQNVDACTGIPTMTEALEATLKVYPNPAKEFITLDLNSDSEITIFNVTGELIYNARLQNGIHILDLSEFSKGVYLLRANGFNAQENLKFIKE